jgi:hypothetical protein
MALYLTLIQILKLLKMVCKEKIRNTYIMTFYICIFLSFIFTILILKYLFRSQREGLENNQSVEAENDKKENALTNSINSNIGLNKNTISKYNKKNTDLNNQLDILEKKVNCKIQSLNSRQDAVKAKKANLQSKKDAGTNYSTKFY